MPKGRIIVLEDLQQVPDGGRFPLPPGAVLSELAREEVERRRIQLIPTLEGTVAIGSDHAGFPMKEDLKLLLRELGYPFHDFGCFDANPVDYPDIAFSVARAVARGLCGVGIILDGAGIGSCMAANKVPGVLAALCYDEATARNSREHNFANVLTLGARLLTTEQMRSIVRSWLQTPYGEERHRRRVNKILQFERYSR